MFGLPGMLWWGLAASIPILIHLFARQRYKRVQWAAMEFLLRAYKKTRKRIRLEHLLLLLLRILALLLFVLALADPHIETGGVLGTSESRREVVVVLDTSFSMGLKEPDGRTPFERAKDQALKLVRGLRRERLDTVTVITAGRAANIVLKGAEDLDRVTAELERLELGDGTTDFVGAFRLVDAVMADLQSEPEVFLLSDLQKGGFVPPREAAAEGEDQPDDQPQELLQSLLQQIRSKGAVVNVVAPADALTDNVAITDVRMTSKAAIAGGATDFTARIRNFGTRATGGTLKFFVDGAGAPAESITIETLPPGGRSTHAFRHTFSTAGHHHVEAVFDTDNLAADNHRHLALEVRDRIATLVVDGSRSSQATDDASFYLTRALLPEDDSVRASTFGCEVIEEPGLELADLSKVDLVVLMNVSLISPSSARGLANFVTDGGGLLIFPGEKTESRVFNNLLWREGSGILPARIGKVLGVDRYDENKRSYELQIKQVEGPPLGYFGDPAILPYVSLVPVYKYVETSFDAEKDGVKVLAVLGTRGDPKAATPPAILQKDSGNGRCIMFATSGDDSWNELPKTPIYLPLVKEIAYFLTRPSSALTNLTVGSSYYMVLKEFVEKVIVSRNEQPLRELKPLPREDDRGFELKLDDLARAGVYRLLLTGLPTGDRAAEKRTLFVAVNVDTRESDLTRIGEDFLFASFPGAGLRYVADLDEAQEEAGKRRSEQIWWWLLLACVACLLAETALSQWFGDRSGRGSAA